MDRRNFLNSFTLVSKKDELPNYEIINQIDYSESDRSLMNQTLDEYTTPLDYHSAAHLLRRVTFGPRIGEIKKLIGKTPKEAIDEIFTDGKEYLEENTNRFRDSTNLLNYIGQIYENPQAVPLELRFDIEGRHGQNYSAFLQWWLAGMTEEDITTDVNASGFKGYPIQNKIVEKLAFFWHTHWCVSFPYDNEEYIPAALLFRNYDKLRKYRLGNFKEMVLEMTLDGAYLLFQNLQLSHKDAPNENYMRELLELFTMGIGHYSEGDIREGARALTGWRVTAHLGDRSPFGSFETYFDRDAHDIGAKIIMGEKINSRDPFDNTMDKVKNEEVIGLINILFDRRPTQIAEFICEKIYKFFVYSNPAELDREFIGELAKVFIDNNFELLPVFQKLFVSKHFYEMQNRGIQVKTPPELIMGLKKALNSPFVSQTEALDRLEMRLYSPPNVSGWNGYRAWISTITYPYRVHYTSEIITSMNKNHFLNIAKSIENYTNFESFVVGLNDFLLPLPADEERQGRFRTFLVKKLNFSATEWTNKVNESDDFLVNATKELMLYIVRLPDFQLC